MNKFIRTQIKLKLHYKKFNYNPKLHGCFGDNSNNLFLSKMTIEINIINLHLW